MANTTEDEIFKDLPILEHYPPLPFISGLCTEPSEVGVGKTETRKRTLYLQSTDGDGNGKNPQVAAKRHKEEPRKSPLSEKTDNSAMLDDVSTEMEHCVKVISLSPSGTSTQMATVPSLGEGTNSEGGAQTETGIPRTQMTSSSVGPSVAVPPSVLPADSNV